MVGIREKMTSLIENISIKIKEIEQLKKVFISGIKTSEEKMEKIIENMEGSLSIYLSRLSISEVCVLVCMFLRMCVCVCECIVLCEGNTLFIPFCPFKFLLNSHQTIFNFIALFFLVFCGEFERDVDAS